MSDDELRALLRKRDESPGDIPLARRAAQLALRLDEREVAAQSWQEVLRRAPRDSEAEARLRAMGCELLYRSTVLGIERFENTRDGAILARTPPLPRLFVAEHAVTNEQFLLFLEASPRASEEGWLRPVTGNPFAYADAAWSLRGLHRDEPVRHVTWRGADAYARWARGRLLAPEEWTKLLVLRAYGWNLLDEWAAGVRANPSGHVQRPIVSATGVRWTSDLARYEGPAFRYARESWF